MQQFSQAQLAVIPQELKEAVCNAIADMTISRVTASGENGRALFGWSPRRHIVSGQLLPRFDQSASDETSDIRIAAIGADFQIDSAGAGQIVTTPSFSVFLRVLPDWSELIDEALDVSIDFKLRREVQDAIDARIRQLRSERLTQANLATPNWPTLNPSQRRDIFDRRAQILEEVRREAYREHGIVLEVGDAELDAAATDETDNTDRSANARDGIEGNGTEAPIDGVAHLQLGRLLQRGRTIPHHLLEPAPPPAKWIRLDLTFDPMIWELGASKSEVDTALTAYNVAMRTAAERQIRDWLKSPTGIDTAWRDLRVQPQDVSSEQSWSAWRAHAAAAPVPEDHLIPTLAGIALQLDRTPDYLDPSRASVRILLDNGNPELGRRDLQTRLDTIFNTQISIDVPTPVHRLLRLDRVEPSYRFRHFLDYPAIGLNCGIVARRSAGQTTNLRTTWSPRFVQPRIAARELDLPTSYARLSDEALDVSELATISREYVTWIDLEERRLRQAVREGLSQEDADRETARLEKDLRGQRDEAAMIERGVQLLQESQQAYKQLARTSDTRTALELRSAPYRAWLYMNRSYLRRERGSTGSRWRLFQLAFILAHIPTLTSRMPEYRDYQNPQMDELAASLLYFPTGGGKSEAFYGALLFAMFLDRLRGKSRGVTAMIRYPLRLLTLQQGQRLLRLVINAELQRIDEKIEGWPFEIGFWVGGNNTPNRYSYVPAVVPLANDPHHPDDRLLEEEEASGLDAEERRQSSLYREYRAAYNKVPLCPICQQRTGLRRFTSDGPTAQRLGIACFNPSCAFNASQPQKAPLPFLLTDDTIYARAPSIVLGTIDKLAMLGQRTTTIRQFLGMFGLARGVGPTGHLHSPRFEGDLASGLQSSGYTPVFPTFRNGTRVFFDPFPSLIIQDEAHLLEESLGTFSGLFDGLLEQSFRSISDMAGADLDVSRIWTGDQWAGPRMPKIVAATATISNPDRQLEVLYQRQPLRFPYPGPDLYRSFFAEPAPAPADNPFRTDLEGSLPSHESPERTAPWMRLFRSVMTNDATHTVTTVTILAAFHAVITHLWTAIQDPSRRNSIVDELARYQGDDEASDWRRAALNRANQDGRQDQVLALIDLHRIGLTYVTNKKGGDQVMDALDAAVQQHHRLSHQALEGFVSRLISGGVDMRTIQEIMEQAQAIIPGQPYPPLASELRNIVATSAISHGVDVDRFNSMFFAGLPSDIAEYIQASSRVGRAYVGFVLLVPTPQSRRDRYVVETHDIFHRFLERMISPPAVERWAENAIRRTLASLVQAWAILRESQLLVASTDRDKPDVDSYETVVPLRVLARNDPITFRDDLGNFILRCIGIEGRGPAGLGRPVYRELYRSLIDQEVHRFVDSVRKMETPLQLFEFWDDSAAPFKPPMTSLRDVDEAGYIVAGAFDERATAGSRQINLDELIQVMKAIRQQRGSVAETDTDAERRQP